MSCIIITTDDDDDNLLLCVGSYIQTCCCLRYVGEIFKGTLDWIIISIIFTRFPFVFYRPRMTFAIIF